MRCLLELVCLLMVNFTNNYFCSFLIQISVFCCAVFSWNVSFVGGHMNENDSLVLYGDEGRMMTLTCRVTDILYAPNISFSLCPEEGGIGMCTTYNATDIHRFHKKNNLLDVMGSFGYRSFFTETYQSETIDQNSLFFDSNS